MYSRSTLSYFDGVSAIELFEQGFTAKSVTTVLDQCSSKCISVTGWWDEPMFT
jgi:transposase